jgi:hypothetical protein
MQANSYSPYALKDLHQAIDLIDRKIAYGRNQETFESEEARESHLRKLASKRAALVKSALALTNLGVRCDPRYLPRSFAEAAPEEGAVADAGEATTTAAIAEASTAAAAAAATTTTKPPRKRR